ncbi:MAG: 16S rRNA (guanine(527)-N(7))-methyltransferase RsmG [Opitutales bacterium]|nr:16S rRNA (guanine(527)-N(7))-methyltransferase RsmG [Opitutales bacterium]
MRTQEEIFARFPELSQEIRDTLMEFAKLLKETNARVNLISRKDEDDIAYRHVAFCLSISKFLTPNKGAKIADVGTGGGLPGIVMAIVWPQAKVFMFDGVGRKIAAISEIIKKLGLKNAIAKKARIEETKETFDYITGRSVCALPQFFNFVKKSIRRGRAGSLENGVIYFKGGELEEELVKKNILPDRELKLDEFFQDPNYEGKRLLHFKFFKR